MKKTVLFLTILGLILVSACGSPSGEKNAADGGKSSVNEDLFIWEGSMIKELTEEGKKQQEIVIPAKCEGFSGDLVFQETDVKKVYFEDDDDVVLGNAFSGSGNLVEVKLPKGLQSIEDSCFYMCTSLKSINIPESITDLKEYTFRGCKLLEEVTFDGDALTRIDSECFASCEALEKIVLPDSVEEIGEYAFYKCRNLKSVVLPKNLKVIGNSAFANTDITELHFPAEIELESIDTSSFGTNTYEMTVYVVEGSWCDQHFSEWDIGFADLKYE